VPRRCRSPLFPTGFKRIKGGCVHITAVDLLLFVSVTDCSQNQTAVSDTLRLLFDFSHDQGLATEIIFILFRSSTKYFYTGELDLRQLPALDAHIRRESSYKTCLYGDF
jgi:hypothetical protein